MWNDPDLHRFTALHRKCLSLVLGLRQDGWQPDLADPLVQLAMQLVEDAASMRDITDRFYKILTPSEAAERGKQLEEEEGEDEVVEVLHDSLASDQVGSFMQKQGKTQGKKQQLSKIEWKCALCDCDHTMLAWKATCATGNLGKLPLPKDTVLCKPCADYLRGMVTNLTKTGKPVTDADLTAKIEQRRNSKKRAENVEAQREEMRRKSGAAERRQSPPKRAKQGAAKK